MAQQTIEQMLTQEHRGLYAAIAQEIQPLLDDESYLQAIARIDMILQGIPVDQENRLLRAAFLVKRGEIKLEAEDYEEAEEDIRHGLHNGMRLPSVYALAGWSQYNLDRPEKAREYFDQVLDEDPDDLSALTGRALVFGELDEPEKALTDLTQALQLDATDASLYAMRAEVLMQLERLEDAERDLNEARRLAPRDHDHALLLARLLTVMRRAPEALGIMEGALARDDDPSLEALLLRSHLHLLNGDGSKARSDAMSASNRFPDEAFALVQLAQVQLSEGNAALAMKAASRAVKLDPTLPDAYLVRGAAARLKGDEAAATQDFSRASQAPAELPMFLFGPAYAALGDDDLHHSMLGLMQGQEEQAAAQAAQASANPFAGLGGMGGMPGMGGMDPMKMMGQMFDEDGNIRGPFKPLLKMALKNAPSILKNMPPSMLKNMGGIDPSMLEGIDFDSLSSDEIESQMQQFAKMMKSGQNPMDAVKQARDELEKNKK